ncbi:MAG: hypothetical protein KDA58_10030 [Planctomycetaceae bacterium]|nr:hypothetical protein [Planctomycetaceae bacterium]
MAGTHLQAPRIIETVEVLALRIRERFPRAGLNEVCGHLLSFAQRADSRSRQISRPMYGVRLASIVLALLFLGLFVFVIKLVRLPDQPLQASEFIQVLEAGANIVLILGAAIFFLVTLENRVKRDRALRAVHELRSLVHVIDMHQLTKDPERVLSPGHETASSPRYNMTRFELCRYLDYCSEMLALAGKIGALYVDDFTDSEAIEAVNDLETLTSGMSRKIWQKINILHVADGAHWTEEAGSNSDSTGQPPEQIETNPDSGPDANSDATM